MRVVLAGGERTNYRNILVANDVRRIAVNLDQFHVPKTKELDLKEKFDNRGIYLYTSESDTDLDGFDSFVRTYADDLEMVVGMPGYDGAWLGTKYFPIWNDEQDMERLAYLCEKVGRVAVGGKALNSKTVSRLNQLKHRWKCELVGIVSSPDMIEAVEWDYVISSGWKSVVRYGETQVWDGYKLHRYPAQQKEAARKQNRAAIARLGCDYDEVLEDNIEEVAKLAIRSWLEWEMVTFHGGQTPAYDPSESGAESPGDTPVLPVDESDSNYLPEGAPDPKPQTWDSSIAIQPPKKRNPEDRALLPILSSGDNSGDNPVYDETPGSSVDNASETEGTLHKARVTLRNCDNCYLAPRCPAMTPGAECAYEIPVELRTKDQLTAFMTALLEIQGDRVMFSAFAELLEGQGMDQQLSKEMDRMLGMIEKVKDISDTRDLLKVQVEARGGAGVLSRIFGESAGEKAKKLNTPVDTNKAAELMSGFGNDTIDAEVIEDGNGSS